MQKQKTHKHNKKVSIMQIMSRFGGVLLAGCFKEDSGRGSGKIEGCK